MTAAMRQYRPLLLVRWVACPRSPAGPFRGVRPRSVCSPSLCPSVRPLMLPTMVGLFGGERGKLMAGITLPSEAEREGRRRGKGRNTIISSSSVFISEQCGGPTRRRRRRGRLDRWGGDAHALVTADADADAAPAPAVPNVFGVVVAITIVRHRWRRQERDGAARGTPRPFGRPFWIYCYRCLLEDVAKYTLHNQIAAINWKICLGLGSLPAWQQV